MEGYYVAILYGLRLVRLRGDVGMLVGSSVHFGGPIEEKISGLEGSYVAILYCLRFGELGNA